jgi:hypothetical protein
MILEDLKEFIATSIVSYAFTTSNVGYPNDESSDACTDSYPQYNTLYTDVNNINDSVSHVMYINPELTIKASSTGGKYIKITQQNPPYQSFPVLIDIYGQTQAVILSCT